MRSTAGLPFLLNEGASVAFVPPQTDLPRNAVVREVCPIDDTSAEVVFEGVDADAARGLLACHCLVQRDTLDAVVFAEEPVFWEGWLVQDENGCELGEVSDVIDNPAQSLIEVSRPDGPAFLVPVVDEIVTDVDVDARLITVVLPNGLLEAQS